MNVKNLIDFLQTCPPNALIMKPGFDHSMVKLGMPKLGTVLQENRSSYIEDFGEGLTPEAEYGKRVEAVILWGD